VRRDRQDKIRPLAISHGANSPRTDRSRFLLEFEWTGTDDPTPWLCVMESIRFMETLHMEGWRGIMAHNHSLAVRARRILCGRLGIPEPCPEDMLGSMAAIPLPDSDSPVRPPLFIDQLQDVLLEQFGIEVPVIPWPARPRRLIRISAQLYNRLEQYERLADALAEVLCR
jgi:isopenicillin-N epimerase